MSKYAEDLKERTYRLRQISPGVREKVAMGWIGEIVHDNDPSAKRKLAKIASVVNALERIGR